jgi:transcriptional regulator with XRE-family HTH domain
MLDFDLVRRGIEGRRPVAQESSSQAGREPTEFGRALRTLRSAAGLSLAGLAKRINYSKTAIGHLETGERPPNKTIATALDAALHAHGYLVELAVCHQIEADARQRTAAKGTLDPDLVTARDATLNDATVRRAAPLVDPAEDEMVAVELARRVAASDVGSETLDALESATDDLAVGYTRTPPAELMPAVRQHLTYVGRLLDARMTIDQHRRLVVVGAWLALLAATVHVDLRQARPAGALLRTARQMAHHAGHDEILAWTLETRAWNAVTAGDFQSAVEFSRQAQDVAPRGSSAHIQATAQEGRAWARMGAGRETRDALNRTARLVSGLATPDRPEHHFRYDPAKADAYVATTLAWVGDPAAETYARDVVRQLERPPERPVRPRRAASARLDLGLALLAAGKPDEASEVARLAVLSGRLAPSTWWRLAEIMAGIEKAGLSEARQLREICRTHLAQARFE